MNGHWMHTVFCVLFIFNFLFCSVPLICLKSWVKYIRREKLYRDRTVATENEIPTNDFDLEKEKRPELSTIKRQRKCAKNIIERTMALTKIKVNLKFDRLKIWVDLNKHGEKVGFRLGQMMKKSDFSYLSPEKKWQVINDVASVTHTKCPYCDEDEYDDEITNNKNGKENKYPNCSLDYNLYRNTIGINNIYIYNDRLIIDITGKFMAEYGDLGCLHKDNIIKVLNKLKDLGLFSFENKKFLKYAGCYLCDCTLDILFPNDLKILRMINAIGSYCPIISDRTKAFKYKHKGILLKRNTLVDQGFSVVVYYKWLELNHRIDEEIKPVMYTQIIGESGENIAKYTLRIEGHLYKMSAIRKFLNIESKTKGFVPLMDVLRSKEPVILSLFKDLGLDIRYLAKSLDGYDLDPKFFNKDDYMPFEYFQKMFFLENLARLLKENKFQIDVLKNHLFTEYNLNIADLKLNRQLNAIKPYLLDFLVYNKPKTISSLIFLFTLITDVYLGEIPPKKPAKRGREKKVKELKEKVSANF